MYKSSKLSQWYATDWLLWLRSPLNIAFEKLLDSIFRDTAWDVSTDISVLHTVLAQEGLTEDDFEKMKQNAEMK